VIVWVLLCSLIAIAQVPEATDLLAAYQEIHTFMLDGGSARANNLTLRRDRAERNLTGRFFFSKPVLGKRTGAVFIG
jgi:hypothetical protein